MKTSEIKKLIDGGLSPNAFCESLDSEISAYAESLDKKGSGVTIVLAEDVDFVFCERSGQVLLEFYLDGKIDEITLEYIGDALELGEHIEFASDLAREIVFDFCNPVVNGQFTKSKATAYMAELIA